MSRPGYRTGPKNRVDQRQGQTGKQTRVSQPRWQGRAAGLSGHFPALVAWHLSVEAHACAAREQDGELGSPSVQAQLREPSERHGKHGSWTGGVCDFDGD